jgi:hypothetical protein
VPGGLHFGAALLDEPDHPLPQIQRISFQAHTLSAYVPMSI